MLKPGITADGFRTAVRDYTEPTVIEELAANSYDADATVFLALLDSKNFKLIVVDNGIGFDQESFDGLATLGSGNKRRVPYSMGERNYLGSYGYGVKSSLNIATQIEFVSYRKPNYRTATIEWDKLEELLASPAKGFTANTSAFNKKTHGTKITLSLKNPTDKTHLNQFKDTLSNLPSDEGKFKCYLGFYNDVANEIPSNDSEFVSKLPQLATRWLEQGLVQEAGISTQTELADCTIEEILDKNDSKVVGKFYFTGFKGEKVKPLKRGLRGIYIRIHGRLLKQSFTDRKFTYNISKWTKFESGLRVELTIDWLRDQITLSREGIRFENAKLENDFKQLLLKMVSSFIQPRMKLLEKKKKKVLDKRAKQRIELAKKRRDLKSDSVVPGIKDGFVFRPESDAELALILAQPSVMKKVLKNHRLIDYNDQAPFDCILYNEEVDEFVNCELEPKLISFLEHNNAKDIELIITWTKTGWKMGASKTGKPGYLTLIAEKSNKVGRYKLLEFASSKSKKPRKTYPVIVLSELLK